MHMALHNLQRLICHKTQPFKSSLYAFLHDIICKVSKCSPLQLTDSWNLPLVIKKY